MRVKELDAIRWCRPYGDMPWMESFRPATRPGVALLEKARRLLNSDSDAVVIIPGDRLSFFVGDVLYQFWGRHELVRWTPGPETCGYNRLHYIPPADPR